MNHWDTHINIHKIDYRGSVCDGPGVRIVVYFQGCNRHCKGCHNPSTWPIGTGKTMSVATLVQEIEENTVLKRITLSGGEPMLQMDGLLLIVKELNRRGYDIALYTGCEEKDIPLDIIYNLNYLKCGAYVEELRTSVRYYGSTNQRFIELRKPSF